MGPLLLPILLLPIPLRRRLIHSVPPAYSPPAALSAPSRPSHQFRLVVVVPVAVLVLYSLATSSTRGRAITGLGLVLAGLVFAGATESVVHGVGGAASAWRRSRFRSALPSGAQAGSSPSREHMAQRTHRALRPVAQPARGDRSSRGGDRPRAACVRARLRRPVTAAGDDRARICQARSTRDRGAKCSCGSRCWAASRWTRCGRCSACCEAVDRGARAPRPTLEQLDALLAAARAGGRVVDLEVEGEHRPLTAGVELAAYQDGSARARGRRQRRGPSR